MLRSLSRTFAHALVGVVVACSGLGTTEVRRAAEPAGEAASAWPASSSSASSSARPVEAAPARAEIEDEERPGVAATDTEDECAEFREVRVVSEVGGPKRHYSLHGYAARMIRIERAGAVPRAHCVLVAWPAGTQNTGGQRVTVASRLRESWFRLIENTLTRIPWHHARLVRRLVIDNRPTEHGIAPFDRRAADDARDGRTIWLHEHLFTDPNHWARGNHGSYFAYHVSKDGVTAHAAPEEHDLFSPVLLHEIGHLVMYHLVNASALGIEATGAPRCAHTCAETNSCGTLPPNERERNCISPYCMPFRFAASTENWAEQYRFYFQSSRTRQLLERADAKCLELLHEHDHGSAPWLSGKPDISDYKPSRWQSCGGKACKGF